MIKKILRDASPSLIVAGLITVVVGYSGPLLIILEAAKVAGLTEAQTASWVWAISIGNAVCTFVLSAFTRIPVIIAWSTPGAALLIASLGDFTFPQAVGAFLVAAIASAVFGFTGWFGWLLDRVPVPILQALLAGVLLPFVIMVVEAFVAAPVLVGAVVVVFLVGKRFFEAYCVPAALVAGIVAAIAVGAFDDFHVTMALGGPVFTAPEFDLTAIISIGLPLFIVAMASQNAPGLALLRLQGYTPNDKFLVGTVSTVSALLTPFGNHGINLAAVSAAIAVGPEAHPDPRRRYIAGLVAGLVYLVFGIFGGYLVAVFDTIPQEIVTALAAVALLGTTLNTLKGALQTDPVTGTASLTTLAVTLSGAVIIGIGSAFWGLVAGVLVYVVLAAGKRATQ